MCSTAPRYPICAKYPALYPPECPKCSALSSSSGCQEYYYNLVEAVNNYTGSPVDEYSFGAGLRKFWEEWDLRILILYILYTQLYLLIFGRFRRRSKRKFLINVNVSLLYIFADLLATIALGKLSKVKDEGTLNKEAVLPKFKPDEICNPHKPESLLRGLWAPVILFCLGGPDTITLLYIEETQLWLKHLISLLTQGGRACYVLIVTWTPSGLSVLSLFMWISGIIKYAERTWVIKSRAQGISEGFLEPNDYTVMDFAPTPNKVISPPSQTELVVEGYICFQTLKPHIPGYHHVLQRPLDKFIKEDRDPEDIFKQIEIELGFMYDMLFSKVGTIFTAWGFILRFITLSCVVCVLVGFFMVDKPSTEELEDDVQITIILLLGAIFLEMVGLLLQLVSDWAVVWACKHESKLSSPVLFLHEHLVSLGQRWSEEMGQFSLLNFCTKYEATVFNKMVRAVCGWRKLLSINFCLPSRKANPTIKALIINQLRERSQKNSGQPSQISSMKAGEWTLTKHGLGQAPKWTMNLEFGEAIVLWHLATDICYHDEEPTDDSEAAKRLSNYMMHLLLICPNTLPFCNTDGDFLTACADIMEILKNQKLTLADACEHLKEIPRERCKSLTVKRAKHLASVLMQKLNEERWEIMSSMWVEMLCYAAKECKLKYHAQELRHGGEFLTHVWLLLMHFGIYGDQETIIPPDLRSNAQEGIKGFNDLTQSTFCEGCNLSLF
ncbi:uncharacterized protein LOC127802030 [Diospyros lotus]|uniref:uncharacterized protein LOC127802030 n=1 Tax=Diospyros lotus TaxID=55363 RepID=UPI0022549748|nr:uncharacterized protein LOC127802030 [Diospyros lotus]XP_052193620.1 uncharacterized protein LOC127802030 [Diospyros lotus]XP_052193621.1 uncharacterized protein LOC127802030 [Diospyros lotus]XP_052193622.1 uncharacterized protein LOC127802030 [Diospyros lotus]